MILPFFIDKLHVAANGLIRDISTKTKILDEAAIRKMGYWDVPEINSRERYYVQKQSSFSSIYCYDICATRYRYLDGAICKHGTRIRKLKKIDYHGIVLYK
jgi:hypothetical protein